MPFEVWTPPKGGWPAGLWDVPYVGSAIPGTTDPASWTDGSNCQRFAYGLLGLFGLGCPPLRSSDLWDDTAATIRAEEPRPLDLVLFNSGQRSYGAHVGVWMAPDEILHLCAEVGRPTVWPDLEFSKRDRYSTLIGYKRVIRTSDRT